MLITGFSMAKWKKDFDPTLMLDHLNRIKIVMDDGYVTFEALKSSDIYLILASMLDLNSEIPREQYIGLVFRSALKAALTAEITGKSLLKCICEFETQYLRQPILPYRFATNISMKLPIVPKTFQVHGSSISVGWQSGKKVEQSRENLIAVNRNLVLGALPLGYATVGVKVSARASPEAATKALDDLDFLRGIWNLWPQGRIDRRFSFGSKRQPINRFVLGPFYTLHNLDGSSANDFCMYEPGYHGPVPVWENSDLVQDLFWYTNAYRRNLESITYRNVIVSALIQYVRALDSWDWDSSFLKLWRIMEQLTGTAKTDNHQATITRAAFISEDIEFELQKLNSLRNSRNQSVHQGTEITDIELQVYLLKETVESLLEFHVRRKRKFPSMDEAVHFLNSPTKLTTVNEKIQNLQAVRRHLLR